MSLHFKYFFWLYQHLQPKCQIIKSFRFPDQISSQLSKYDLDTPLANICFTNSIHQYSQIYFTNRKTQILKKNQNLQNTNIDIHFPIFSFALQQKPTHQIYQQKTMLRLISKIIGNTAVIIFFNYNLYILLNVIYSPSLLISQLYMKQLSVPPPQSQKIASFVSKLQQILSDEENSAAIHWEENGKSFVIKNLKMFQETLLPRYFRHSRMSSFVRQLNMYGFHKVRTSSDLIIFSHQNFQKDNLENAVVLRKLQGPPSSKKQIISSATQTPVTKLSLEAQSSQQNISMNFIEKVPDMPISEMVLKLVDQVNSQHLILDCDIKSKVKDLLRQEPYNKIDKKLTPFILNSLGVQSQPSLRNINQLNINSDAWLKSYNFIESLKFIL